MTSIPKLWKSYFIDNKNENMKKILSLVTLFLVTFFVIPQVTYANTSFIVSNMDFSSTTGDFSFDYDAG